MNQFGETLLDLLQERGLAVPDLSEEMKEMCCGRVCRCRKLSPWDLATMMTARYLDEMPYRLYATHFLLLADVLGLRHDYEEHNERGLFWLFGDSLHTPIYRPLFERAEELAPAGSITRNSTPEEAMQVLWSHGESLPEGLLDLLESEIRRGH